MMRVKPSTEDLKRFADAVQALRYRDDVCRAVQNLYDALADAIDLRKPICVQSGRCCHFDDFGHSLFVTTMEMATFMNDRRCHFSGNVRNVPLSGCPFQIDKLCSVHSIRPLGCRIFFCDQTATDWQHVQYASLHSELKRLHETLKIPYFYLEWRQALAAVDGTHVNSPL